jgi:hypothetical protein
MKHIKQDGWHRRIMAYLQFGSWTRVRVTKGEGKKSTLEVIGNNEAQPESKGSRQRNLESCNPIILYPMP